jgi:hypothetical protein
MNRRNLRSTPSVPPSTLPHNAVPSPVNFTAPLSNSQDSHNAGLRVLAPGSNLPGLTFEELTLLHEKQKRLVSNASSILDSLPHSVKINPRIRNALHSTLIFAQYEAGTAVCIDPSGWVLTCSHCFGDTEKEWKANKRKWLLFYTGLAVQVECRVWDSKRDLALAKIIAIESSEGEDSDTASFYHVRLFSHGLSKKTPILCIGQPGRDDLESTSNRRTKYNLIEVSQGTFCGMVPDVDPHDNYEIGTLKHNAWTYWGHSGALLVRATDGTLVGLHSSWDDQTAMRHGIPPVAIQHFLEQHLQATVDLPISTVAAAAETDATNDEKSSFIVIDDD